MSESHGRNVNRRVMCIPAVAATYYPTGVTLGIKDAAANVNGATATVDTTAANSWYAKGVADETRNPLSSRWGAVIVSIVVTTPVAGTVTIESHAGTALSTAIDTSSRGFLAFDDGFPILGGFRVTTSAASALMIEYELVER